MPTPRRYQVISCDGHLEIPPDPWVRRIPEEFRDRAPRLVSLNGGGEGWIVEGSPMIHNGQNVAAGRRLKVRGGSYWEPDGSPAPGTGDAAQRLAEQDRDGIDAEVLYAPVFITRFIENIEDREAYVAMVRAFNDFLAEDYCAVAPDRLIANAVIPVSGLEDAIGELKRTHSLGFRSIALTSFPNGTGEPDPEDDQFWHAAMELGLAITAHAALGDRSNPLLVQSARGAFDLPSSMLSRTMPPPLTGMVRMMLSGLLDRIPELRLYFAETNASWIPGHFYMVDDSYGIFREWFGVDLAMKPSEYMWKHFSFGIVRDPLALRMHELLDLDHIMWGSDFPHSVSSYPESHRWLDEIFATTPAAVRQQVLLENPCRYFGLDPSAELTATPAGAGGLR